jgi:N-acetylmuramoyl-L-alanine amidase
VLSASTGKTGSRLVLDFSGAYADITPLKPSGAFAFQKAIGTRFTAVIDPGHGGKDPGARGVLTEEPLNLEVAKRVTAQLQAAGVEVLMTRTTAGTFSNDKALDLASRAAQAINKSVFVSIHANARPPRNANTTFGTEVYYYSPSDTPKLFPAPIVPAPLRTAETTRLDPKLLEIRPPEIRPPEIRPSETRPPETRPLETRPLDTKAGEVLAGGLEQLGEALQILDGSPKPTQPAPSSIRPGPSAEQTGFSSPPLESSPGIATPEDFAYLPLEPTSFGESPERALESQQLALSVLSHVLGSAASSNGGARNADYFVIKQSECPAILVEMGYVTHPVEGVQLKDSNYLDRIAYGISYGVLEYLEGTAKGI